VISGVLGFVLTPLGLWLISYGGERQRIRFAEFLSGSDALGVTMMVLGALVLFGVATLGALSSTGPIVGGVFWGVVPGIAMMADRWARTKRSPTRWARAHRCGRCWTGCRWACSWPSAWCWPGRAWRRRSPAGEPRGGFSRA
jgi:hypothetical protein